MTNRERLQRLDPVDRYRFLKNALFQKEFPKNALRELLNSNSGSLHLFIFSETPEDIDYWWERIKIMEA